MKRLVQSEGSDLSVSATCRSPRKIASLLIRRKLAEVEPANPDG